MAPRAAAKGGNALTRKLGPLPVWVWVLAGAVLAWFVFFRTPAAPAQATQAGPGAGRAIPGSLGQGGSAGGGASPPAGRDSALLAQLAAAGALGGGGGEGVTAGEAGGTGGTGGQTAADAGAAPSSIQQDGTAAAPTDTTTTSSTNSFIGGGGPGDTVGPGGVVPYNSLTMAAVASDATSYAANPALFDAPQVAGQTAVQGTAIKVA